MKNIERKEKHDEALAEKKDERLELGSGVHEKKVKLQNAKETLRKRSEGFRKSERQIGRVLQSFQGRHDELYDALDAQFRPRAKGEPTWFEKNKRRELMQELDNGTPDEERREGMRATVYLHLTEERVLEAEDRLNGTREQMIRRGDDFEGVVARTAAEFLDTSPGLSKDLSAIIHDRNLGPQEKMTELVSLFADVNGEGERRSVDALLAETEVFQRDMAGLEAVEEQQEAELKEARARHEESVRRDEARRAELLLGEIPENPENSGDRRR